MILATSDPALPRVATVQVSSAEVTVQLVESTTPGTQAPGIWRPAVNAFRCADRFLILVDLPGVPLESIHITAQPRRLHLRGTRPPAEPDGSRECAIQLLALEIDHGAFERVLDLPLTIDPRGLTAEVRDGICRIELPLASE